MALCDINRCSTDLCGISTSCVSQVPSSKVMVQPAPFSVTVPGPILSASTEPVAVAQYTPYAAGFGGYPYGGYGGYGMYGGYGWGSGLGYGRRYGYGSPFPYCYPGYSRRYSYCGPC